jgi:hypothetical protein
VAVAAMLGALSTYLLAPLHPNIRYAFGVQAVSSFSASETFSHRPLAYRLLMDLVARLADPLAFGITSFEAVVRLIGLGLAVGSGVLLWRGLQDRRVVAPGLHALVAISAIVFMGTTMAMEPDWLAPILTAAGTGAALVGRGRLRWPMAFLAGALFVAAAAMKIVTLPVALVGLLVVGVLDRRQLVRSLVGCLVVGVLFVVATLIWVPWEVTWISDLRLVRHPIQVSLTKAPMYFLESAARRPAIALFPAALILADRTERLVLAAAGLLAAMPVVVVGEYFGYHGATLCGVSAIAVFRMFRWRVTNSTGIAVLTIVLAAAALSVASPAWRESHRAIWATATVAVCLGGIGWAVVVRRHPVTRQPLGLLLAAAMATALLYPAMTPVPESRARLVDTGTPTVVARGVGAPMEQEDTARQIHQRIGGRHVTVTYLTFGEWPYFLRNPSSCRYPSPAFLKLTKYTTAHIGTRSYLENQACIDEPTSRWLILDRRWFKLGKAPPELQARVAATWDCSAALSIGGLTMCPRRP